MAQVLAGRWINFEGLAFAGKAILRQNTSDPAICQLCLPFRLNNSKILGKSLIIPLFFLISFKSTHRELLFAASPTSLRPHVLELGRRGAESAPPISRAHSAKYPSRAQVNARYLQHVFYLSFGFIHHVSTFSTIYPHFSPP